MNDFFEPPVYGLVFDMDGLIFDSERVVKRSWDYAGEKLGYEHFGEHIYHTIGFNLARRTEYFRNNVSSEFPMDQFAVMTRARFHEIIDNEGLDRKPGVEELLKYAKQKELRIALATSSRREHASSLLKRYGLYDYFDGEIYGDMVTSGKPSPEIYLKACQEIGVSPVNAIALEDAPAGIRSAHTAGMRTVMVPDLVEPDEKTLKMVWHRYDTLFDFLEFLKRNE